MTNYNRLHKKAESFDRDFEIWFRAHRVLVNGLRYAESLAETRTLLASFKMQMKRGKNRLFISTRLSTYVTDANQW